MTINGNPETGGSRRNGVQIRSSPSWSISRAMTAITLLATRVETDRERRCGGWVNEGLTGVGTLDAGTSQ